MPLTFPATSTISAHSHVINAVATVHCILLAPGIVVDTCSDDVVPITFGYEYSLVKEAAALGGRMMTYV